MASNTPVKAPDWWILSKGFTVEHGGWKPSLSFWRLITPPLYLSLRGLGNLLLLYSSLGLVFQSRTRSPSFYYLFSFMLSLPFWIIKIKLKWYRGLRREKGRGGGSFGCVNFSGASLPGCNSIKCIKLLWPFLWMPISSEVVMPTCCWESMSVDILSRGRLIKHFKFVRGFWQSHNHLWIFFFFFFLFFLFFLLFLKNGLGWGCSYRRGGHKEWLSEGCTFRDWNTFWNYESFISNTNTVKPRVVGFYHTLGGLECARIGCVPKNQMRRSQLTVGFIYIHLGS